MKIDLSQLITAEAKARAALLAAEADLADLRWRHEVGGITLKGIGPVATDRETQSRLTGLVQAHETGLMAAPVSWKTAGAWVDLGAEDLRAMAQAVTAHVQTAFAAERAVLAQVQAGKIGAGQLEKAFAKALTRKG
jgi:hypothetical protein